MPYKTTADLPPALHHLPIHAQKVFLAAFNASSPGNDESAAFKIAWAAVHKAGYSKNSAGKWTRSSKES